MIQFHSWLQRRRQHYSPVERRKSATESKVPTPGSTPKLLGSPRLARLHRKIFRASSASSPQTHRTQIPVEILDDSDRRSTFELPVRIYFPPSSPPLTTRHVRITDMNIMTGNNYNNNQDISIEPTASNSNRKYASASSLKVTTAKERRESFATSSTTFTNRYL
jgi:hypothetical protein